MSVPTLLAKALRSLGLVRYDLLARRTDAYPAPDSLADGELVVVVDGGMHKWACMRCPGGCGTVIPLSLTVRRRPRWSVTLDWLRRPTIDPSIHQTNECACHFWITGGRVRWCGGGQRTTGSYHGSA
jgi:hypothetical protein